MAIGAHFDLCMADASKRLKRWNSSNYKLLPTELELYSWPQRNPVKVIQTVVIIGPCGDACVYHGRFSYYLPDPTPAFWEALAARDLPEVSDPARKKLTR